MLDTVEQKQIADELQGMPDKLVLSNPFDKSYPYKKTVIHKILMKKTVKYQIERFTARQAFHENVEPEALVDAVLEQFPSIYGQLNIFEADRQWDYKMTKKGRLLSNTHKGNSSARKEAAASEGATFDSTGAKRISVEGMPMHNRRKNYILAEGTVVPPLVDLGIFTKEGKVVRTMYDKYKQINRFLELVEDVVKDAPDQEMRIIDFGCGKSYLTFILYYYLVEVRGYRVHMTGLDLKEDVIAKCNETARKYHYENLHFELGDINGYQTDEPVDMVVTLHACDTATDFALYNAISWNAKMIFSVPCCQHELNKQMQPETLTLLSRYGIIKERFSALATDAIRGNLLEYCGYKTQILEFIDFDHTPKNLMIRAVRRGATPKSVQTRAKKEIDAMISEFGVEPTLYKLLEL